MPKKPKPKIGRPPTARGAYNPNPCRQLGRVGDADWQEIRQGARDADQNYTQWAVKCLLREARLATGTRLKDAQDAASKAAKTQAKNFENLLTRQRTMARVNAKQTVYTDPATKYFERLSKSALIDILVDTLKRENGEDSICSEVQARDMAEPVLRMRGDRIVSARW